MPTKDEVSIARIAASYGPSAHATFSGRYRAPLAFLVHFLLVPGSQFHKSERVVYMTHQISSDWIMLQAPKKSIN